MTCITVKKDWSTFKASTVYSDVLTKKKVKKCNILLAWFFTLYELNSFKDNYLNNSSQRKPSEYRRLEVWKSSLINILTI